jgi:hypothetical protein
VKDNLCDNSCTNSALNKFPVFVILTNKKKNWKLELLDIAQNLKKMLECKLRNTNGTSQWGKEV